MLPICSKIKKEENERLFCLRMNKIIFALHKKANDFFMLQEKKKSRATTVKAE